MSKALLYWAGSLLAIIIATYGAATHHYFGAACWGLTALFLAYAAEIYRR